jgi:hypothetical protein
VLVLHPAAQLFRPTVGVHRAGHPAGDLRQLATLAFGVAMIPLIIKTSVSKCRATCLLSAVPRGSPGYSCFTDRFMARRVACRRLSLMFGLQFFGENQSLTWVSAVIQKLSGSESAKKLYLSMPVVITVAGDGLRFDHGPAAEYCTQMPEVG